MSLIGGSDAGTFGALAVGSLFKMPSDPDDAVLRKVSRSKYIVVSTAPGGLSERLGSPARGLKFSADASQRVRPAP